MSTISQSRIFWNRQAKKILLVYEFIQFVNEGFLFLMKTLFLIHEKQTIQTSKNHNFALNGRHFVRNHFFEKSFVHELDKLIY